MTRNDFEGREGQRFLYAGEFGYDASEGVVEEVSEKAVKISGKWHLFEGYLGPARTVHMTLIEWLGPKEAPND